MVGPAAGIVEVLPNVGTAGGGDLVRIVVQGLGPDDLYVLFGDATAEVVEAFAEAGLTYIDVHTPPHDRGEVDVAVGLLDSGGIPVPGTEVVLPGGYTYRREEIVAESDLTRLVRTLLKLLKRQTLENTSIAVSVDYDDTPEDGLDIVVMSELPSLVLSGPRMPENRFYSTNVHREEERDGPDGPEAVSHRPPYTVDLEFTITGASNRTVELLNLMAAIATVLHRNRWIEMPRDPSRPKAGNVRWEMDPLGEFRTRLDGPDDVRAFSCGLVIRGFDLAEGLPEQVSRPVDDLEVETTVLETEGVFP